jgi:hypothetical protein
MLRRGAHGVCEAMVSVWRYSEGRKGGQRSSGRGGAGSDERWQR